MLSIYVQNMEGFSNYQDVKSDLKTNKLKTKGKLAKIWEQAHVLQDEEAEIQSSHVNVPSVRVIDRYSSDTVSVETRNSVSRVTKLHFALPSFPKVFTELMKD